MEFPGSEKQQLKNDIGNRQVLFVIKLVKACLASHTKFWVENPDLSWMWRLDKELSWNFLEGELAGEFRCDFCRFGTQWRKRTRFKTDLTIAGQTCFCKCTAPHLKLRGKCPRTGLNMTKLAEPYPRQLSKMLAGAVLSDLGYLGENRSLNVNKCARCGPGRIGEASNPGPRRGVDRSGLQHLSTVELLEPATRAIRSRMIEDFYSWVSSEFGEGFGDRARRVPLLFVQLLIGFGHFCFEANLPLHYFRQLLAHVQREMIGLRPYMSPAWDLVSRWEFCEPVQHRPPLPEPVARAMAAVAIGWGWYRFAASLLFAFYSASRVGEVLRATRQALLTPADLLAEDSVVYLRIESPKSRGRGPKIQYVSCVKPEISGFVSWVWQDLSSDCKLFPLSAGAFRSRWNSLLKHISIGPELRLTPGSLRAGGAVALHKGGVAIQDLMWRMRLQHMRTLTFYLQETTASSILPALDSGPRDNIRLLQDALPMLITLASRPAAHNVAKATSSP